MKKTLLVFLLLISIQSFSQDIIMQNGTINTCSGTFYDSGGATGNYSPNESYIFTICPETSEQRIKAEFNIFSTQLYADVLKVYDGDSINETMFGQYSGNSSNFPGLFVATVNNSTGCLTFEFTSNGSANTTGWAANISCLEACQNITAQIDSTNPAPNTDGFIDVCIGDPITFNGSGTFEVDGTGATYNWDLGDGTTVEGESVTVSYAIAGVFLVSLEIRDTNTSQNPLGCNNTNAVHQIVRVSNTPDFTGTEANNDVLCFGESTNIEGMAVPQTLIYDCPPPESVETFLPDGSGAVYNTCINVTCFDPSATLTDISQIADICMNIEHSYLGDLQMKIISPNGQEVILKNYPGGASTYLGGANDDASTDPGVGADYCFSMDATDTLINGSVITAGSPPDDSIAPGTYLPDESFAQLIGSPLNGQWCIEIVDNLAVDNGYIFSWELNFDDNLPQEGFDYTPAIVTESWDSDPSITSFNGNTITVTPTTSGIHCYTYRTTDEFGCEYTEQVCITVAEAGVPPQTYYSDNDNDGYGDANSYIVECSSVPPYGYVLNNLDCNDNNNLINPDAEDSEGNGIDENCDGVDGDTLSTDDFNINTVHISPNPFNNEFNINLPAATQSHTVNVSIYDLSGRKVYTQQYANNSGSITIDNLDALNKNIYFVTISNQTLGIDVTKKILKR